MDHLQKENNKDFRLLVSKSVSAKVKAEARVRFLRRQAKMVILIEELSLRSRRISPLIKQLRKFSDRMKFIRLQLSKTGEESIGQGERKRLRSCLLYTSPSPRDATLSRMPSSA